MWGDKKPVVEVRRTFGHVTSNHWKKTGFVPEANTLDGGTVDDSWASFSHYLWTNNVSVVSIQGGFGGDPGVLQNQYLQVFCWVWCSIEMMNLQNSRRSDWQIESPGCDSCSRCANGAYNKKVTWSVQGVLTYHEGTNMCCLLKILYVQFDVMCVCVSTRHLERRCPNKNVKR